MNEAWLIEQFKWLHRHPELGDQEYETTRFLTDILLEHRIKLLDTGLETGAIAQIGSGSPVVCLRADIDALPIREETGLPYASENDGVMHACGHDFHAACMLGAALLLKEKEAELPGTVKIVFQPAEEIDHGGKRVVATALLNDVQAFYAGHTYPWFKAGTLGIKPGPVMAAADPLHHTDQGKGRARCAPGIEHRRDSGDGGAHPVGTEHRQPQRQSLRQCRGINHPCPGRQHLEHHSGDGRTGRYCASTRAICAGRHPGEAGSRREAHRRCPQM